MPSLGRSIPSDSLAWRLERQNANGARFLGEVEHSHRPMLGPASAVAKQVFFVMTGPWG